MKKRAGNGGFALLAVLVTLTVLQLMWATAYLRSRAALSVELAGVDRSRNVDGPALAAARALDYLEIGGVSNGAACYRTTVPTADGSFTYRICYVGQPADTNGPGPNVSWQVTVTPHDGIEELDVLPVGSG